MPVDAAHLLPPTPRVALAECSPLCDEAEFAELMDEMVLDEAPRLFAVVQVCGERVDGRIAAWGLAFDDRAEATSVCGRLRVSSSSPERVVRRFALHPDITARVVWVQTSVSGPGEALNLP